MRKLKNEVVERDGFTRYKLGRSSRKGTNYKIFLDYGNKFAIHDCDTQIVTKGGGFGYSRYVFSKYKSWNLYYIGHVGLGTPTKRLKNISNQNSPLNFYTRASEYRANRYLKRFCKNNDIKIKFTEYFMDNLRLIMYPVLSNFDRATNWENYSDILRKANSLPEIVRLAFGTNGKATRKKVYSFLEYGRFSCLGYGTAFKGLVDNNAFLDGLDDFRHVMCGYDLHHTQRKELRRYLRQMRPEVVRNFALDPNIDQWAIRDTLVYLERYPDRFDPTRRYNEFMEFHDDITFRPTQVTKEKEYKLNLSYHQKENDGYTTNNGWQYKLVVPHTNYELQSWGNKMHNCIGGYDRAQHNGNVDLWGVEIDGKLRYNIAISNYKIEQFFGACNQRPDTQDEYHILSMLNKVYNDVTLHYRDSSYNLINVEEYTNDQIPNENRPARTSQSLITIDDG